MATHGLSTLNNHDCFSDDNRGIELIVHIDHDCCSDDNRGSEPIVHIDHNGHNGPT